MWMDIRMEEVKWGSCSRLELNCRDEHVMEER